MGFAPTWLRQMSPPLLHVTTLTTGEGIGGEGMEKEGVAREGNGGQREGRERRGKGDGEKERAGTSTFTMKSCTRH